MYTYSLKQSEYVVPLWIVCALILSNAHSFASEKQRFLSTSAHTFSYIAGGGEVDVSLLNCIFKKKKKKSQDWLNVEQSL